MPGRRRKLHHNSNCKYTVLRKHDHRPSRLSVYGNDVTEDEDDSLAESRRTHEIDVGDVMVDFTDVDNKRSRSIIECNVICPTAVREAAWYIGDEKVDDSHGLLMDGKHQLNVRQAIEKMKLPSNQYTLTFSYKTEVGVDITVAMDTADKEKDDKGDDVMDHDQSQSLLADLEGKAIPCDKISVTGNKVTAEFHHFKRRSIQRHELPITPETTSVELLVWTPKDALDFRWTVKDNQSQRVLYENLLEHDPALEHDLVNKVLLESIPELGINRAAVNCILRMKVEDGVEFPETFSLRYLRSFTYRYKLTVVRSDFIYTALCRDRNLDVRSMIEVGEWESLIGYTDNDVKSKGQTVLHLAIAKEDEKLVEKICEMISKSTELRGMLKSCATGEEIPDVCYYGGTLIATAILTGNTTIINNLLNAGVSLEQRNHRGDNFWHSLVKYANDCDTEESEIPDIKRVLRSFSKERKQTALSLLKERDSQGLNPLLLAYSLADVKMIETITDIGHRRMVHQRGSFDIEVYDVRHVDTITNRIKRIVPKSKTKHDGRGTSEWRYFRGGFLPESEAGLQMLFSNQLSNEDQIRLADTKIVRCLIEKKWETYRLFISSFAVLFFVMLIILVSYSSIRQHNNNIFKKHAHLMYRSKPSSKTLIRNGTNITEVNYTELIQTSASPFRNYSFDIDKEAVENRDSLFFQFGLFFTLVCGVLNMTFSVMIVISRCFLTPNPYNYMLHNIDYVFLYCIFSALLILDFVFVVLKIEIGIGYDGEFLFLGILCGWMFSTIFTRVYLKFGLVIDLIRRVVKEDLLDFLAIMFIIVLAFAPFLHHLLKYKYEDGDIQGNADYFYFNRTIFTMFSVALGTKEIDVWDKIETAWIAVILFTVFLVIGYLLLLNCLIAVTTNTCSLIFQNKQINLRLHRLSCVLFFEDMFWWPLFLRPMSAIRVKQEMVNGDLEPVFEICLKRKRHDE